MPEERALTFECEGAKLVGILSEGNAAASRGVLIVVGGPQYRVGSHRQFALLARYLAANGLPTLRFDYRGMGDSQGDMRTFEHIDMDIRCAIDCFFLSVPKLRDVVIWGLCDAASAALFYAHRDPRVVGLVLLNPWVRTEQGSARTYLRHYYLSRLFQPQLWRKIASGEFSVRRALADFGRLATEAVNRGSRGDVGQSSSISVTSQSDSTVGELPERMERGLRSFAGRVLLVLSGNDLTAQEFKDLVAGSHRWRRLLANERVTRQDLAEANHTFSRREWRDQVARWTETWVKSW